MIINEDLYDNIKTVKYILFLIIRIWNITIVNGLIMALKFKRVAYYKFEHIKKNPILL